MKIFKLAIHMDGAAFDNGWHNEAARILRKTAGLVEDHSGSRGSGGALILDINGNSIGRWRAIIGPGDRATDV